MKRIKFVLSSLLGSLTLLPALALAQGAGGAGNFTVAGGVSGFLTSLRALMGVVVPILIGLGIIVFLWGVLKFILNAGDEAKRSEGKMFMIYGLIGIVVMVSVWALVAFIQYSFGLQNGGTVQQGPVLPAATNQ